MPYATTCTEIPAGSTTMNRNNETVTFREPVPTGYCESETENGGKNARSRTFNCTADGASETYYEVADCKGTPAGTNPINTNGQCMTGGCAGFTRDQFENGRCEGKPESVTTNEYLYFDSSGKCAYNSTQSCVNGQPQFKFYNNTGKYSLYIFFI